MLAKLIFTWLLGTGIVQPMNEQNDERDLYYLYVLDEQKEVFVFEHAYEEEIINYIETGEFKYNEALGQELAIDKK